MVRLFLALALAITVASQPLDTIATSGGATLTTQLWNWAQVGLEAFLQLVRRSFREETTTSTTTTTTTTTTTRSTTSNGLKVLVATGDGPPRFGSTSSNTKITEIIDVENASFRCTASQFPYFATGATGGLVGDTPLICGGYVGFGYRQKSCYSLKDDGGWKLETSSDLNKARNSAANGHVIMNNQMVVAGGYSDSRYSLATIEVVAPNSTTETLPIRLPVPMYGSCMVPWDTHTFMIIGGWAGRYRRKQTYFIHMANNTYTTGPDLLTARGSLACHTMQVNGEDFIIVAGGRGTKSTEYLPKANYASGWVKSVDLPVNIYDHEMVASQDNKVLYTIGNGYASNNKDIFKFACTNNITNCSWTKSPAQLQYGRRSRTVAMTIPYTLAQNICH